MNIITVDINEASRIATNIANNSSNLRNVGNVTKDTQTTIAGNKEASRVIDQSNMVSEKIIQLMSNMSDNIHTVAADFKVLDEKAKYEFKNIGFTLND